MVNIGGKIMALLCKIFGHKASQYEGIIRHYCSRCDNSLNCDVDDCDHVSINTCFKCGVPLCNDHILMYDHDTGAGFCPTHGVLEEMKSKIRRLETSVKRLKMRHCLCPNAPVE